MRWELRIVIAIAFVGCLRSDLVPCGDALCPASSVCTPGGCATPENANACAGIADGATCSTVEIAEGSCAGGSCHAVGCGNGIVDPGEVCDDGNTSSGDGCSGDCRSNETCGNGIVDGEAHEQCDDGNLLSGDGCSSTCTEEFDAWATLAPVQLARAQHAMTYDANERRIVLFGGIDTDGNPLGDTWEWDGSAWNARQPAVAPSPRSQFAMAYDTTRGRVVVFGGVDASEVDNDTWEWDGVLWTRQTPTVSPPPRRDARMAEDRAHHQLVLFGGEDDTGTMVNDTWLWDGVNWTQAATTGPSTRKASPMAWDAAHGYVLLYSGTQSESTADAWSVWLNDVWAWDGAAWTEKQTPGGGQNSNPAMAYDPDLDAPVVCVDEQGGSVGFYEWPGSGMSFFDGPESGPWAPRIEYDGTQLVRFGGLGIGEPVDDTYVGSGSGSSLTWTEATPPSNGPSPRTEAEMFYDERRGTLVLVGGHYVVLQYGDDSATPETWEWNGAQWVSDGAAPGGDRAAVVYDSARGVAVLYGGYSGGALGATWERQGTVWSQVSITGATPGTRAGHAMAYDRATKQTILFGGLGSGGTWAYDGTGWTEVATAGASPPDRAGASMAYDIARDRVVLFGGLDATNTWLDDVWEWDGTAWMQRAPVSSPAARDEAVMVYDPRRQRVVMFGGHTSAGTEQDAWEWDGTAWTPRAPSNLVPPRAGAAGAYDALHGKLVVFGGLTAIGGSLGDLWAIGFVSLQSPPDQCEGVDTDGDGLAGCADPDCAARCTPDCPFGAQCDPALPHCGDGTCSVLEDYRLCPADCPAQ